jgi:predicted AAA+ superfamily ATPase
MGMLEGRRVKVLEAFRGKLYTYKKYHTLTPTIRYSLPFELRVERRLLLKEKSVSVADVVRHIRNKDNIVIVEGEDGLGKSTLLADISKLLRENEKLNVLEFAELRKEKNRIKDELFQLTKNVIFIDNADLYEAETLSLIDNYSKGNFEVSFCVATSKPKLSDLFHNRYPHLTIVETRLVPFDSE